MMLTTAFTACGGDDDSGSPISGGGSTDGTQTTTKEKLVGTWQAVAAKGYHNDRTVDTKEIYGLDSLSGLLPPLIIINSDGTFESYRASWTSYKYINGSEYPSSYSWRKSGGSGEGTYLLVGNQIQLNDSYGYSYSTNATIVSLTNDRMVLHAMEGTFADITVTYGRDGYGAEYFTYPYVNRNIQYAGDWILTYCSDESAPIGATFTFNNDGTGCINSPYDVNFTFFLESTGEFTIDFDEIWHHQGIIHITDTEARGFYVDYGKQYYFTLTRK